MKNWFKRQKVILISFFILSIILFLVTAIQINIITQPEVLEELSNYITTNEITSSLKKYVFVVVINMIVFAVWALLFLILMWRVFFPTKKAMRDAFSIDSFMFLYKMPGNLKKELKRDE